MHLLYSVHIFSVYVHAKKNFKCASINNEAWPLACLIARGMLMARGRAIHALTPMASKHSPECWCGWMQGFISAAFSCLEPILTAENPIISSTHSLEVERVKILI